MTLLTAIQDACDELGIIRPLTAIGSTDQSVRQLTALANREATELSQQADWVELQRLQTMTTVANQAEYDLPADFDHYIVETAWDRSDFEPMQGPLTPQAWQSIKSGLLGSGIFFRRYRVYRSATSTATKFTIDPTPTTSGDELVSEYVSNHPWRNAAGTDTKVRATADTDVLLLPENLLVMGIIWRWLRAKGLDYQTQLLEYNQALDSRLGKNRPAPTLSLNTNFYGLQLLGAQNIPDTGYGGV